MILKRTCFVILSLVATSLYAGEDCARHPAPAIQALIRKWHPMPPVLNDTFYNNVLTLFINNADNHRFYFFQADVDSFRARKQQLRDELEGKSHQFIEYAAAIYLQRILMVDSVVSRIVTDSLDFAVAEIYQTNYTEYCADVVSLESRWRQSLKQMCLTRLYHFHRDSKPWILDSWKIKTAQKIFAMRYFEGQKNFRDTCAVQQACAIYLCDAICKAADPHSYFSQAKDKSDDDVFGTAPGTYFGLAFKDHPNGIVINSGIPGSSAWQSGEFESPSFLLALREPGNPWNELEQESADSVYRFLRQIKGAVIELRIQKNDSIEKIVTLQKKFIKPASRLVNSYVLTDSLGLKMGYLRLPSFYGPYRNANSTHSFDDLLNELIHLNQDGVSGLILDLRDNGGGYISEAVYLAGLFLDKGPVAMEIRRNEKPVIYSDPNQGTFYDKPMVVLVNENTASASELLAGALQDYNRAVIFGSRTFGKASVQQTLSLDTTAKEMDGYKWWLTNSWELHLTTGLMCRPTGKSNQQDGVSPDIPLPEITDRYRLRERDLAKVMYPATVKPAKGFNPSPPLPIADLLLKSKKRTESNGFATEWKQRAEDRKRDSAGLEMPLRFQDFLAYQKSKNTKALNANEQQKYLEVSYTQSELEQRKMRALKSNSDVRLFDRISTDKVLFEASQILADLIKSRK
ncbi:MAG: S41 family peptidase [Chitinophagales bacterium]